MTFCKEQFPIFGIGYRPPFPDPVSAEDEDWEGILGSDATKGAHGYSPLHPLMGASLISSGAGIKEGVVVEKISNTDVAPTMAAVLRLEMEDVKGRVLEEILESAERIAAAVRLAIRALGQFRNAESGNQKGCAKGSDEMTCL